MVIYKQRTIELSPRRYEDGTWRCLYRIFEFRPACWGYHKGCPEGVFASRQAAAAVSLKEAKQVVDWLNTAVHNSQAIRRSMLTVEFHKALPPSLLAFRIENDSLGRIEKDSSARGLIR